MRRSSTGSIGSTASRHGSSLSVSSSGSAAPGSHTAYKRRPSAKFETIFETRRGSATCIPNPASNMWSNTVGKSIGLIPGRAYAGPLFLCLACPFFITYLCQIIVNWDGSLAMFWKDARAHGVLRTFYENWPTCRNLYVWKMIGAFMISQLAIMRLMPGKTYRGPVSPAGNIPVYTANGFQAFSLTLITYILLVYTKVITGGVLYDYVGEILSSMNVFALIFCALLYLKGQYLPSTSDHGTSGNAVFDFYWGIELYPRVLGWDVKQFTNCRCGMMFWALFVLSCYYKQQETYGTVSYGMYVNVILQLVYIAKFFWWETGYLSTMDIAHDRAGFYICWGVLAFLPCVYTSHSMYLAEHPDDLSVFGFALLLNVGLAAIWINYDCDRQRQTFRRTQGQCKIWNKDPFFIEAKYRTETGEMKTSLLLGSGWWGITRHFHYLPELLAAVCWTVPVCSRAWLPYVYVPYLTVLLLDRAFRDDARCHSKYGKYWEQYCKRVPHMIIPGIL